MRYDKPKWRRLHSGEKCGICSEKTWCTVSCDGKSAHCMRVESGLPARKGGWIHSLDKPRPEYTPPPQKRRAKVNANEKATTMFDRPEAPLKRKWLSEQIGISIPTLELLMVGVGWDKNGREYASFPSRGEKGQIIGVTRRYDSGEKRTIYGTSNAGVFCVPNWWTYGEILYIVEGGSDVGALTDAGLAAIGRPSNTGGSEIIAHYLRRHPFKRIVVLGENDEKPDKKGQVSSCHKNCRGCAFCWPGKYGMIETAKALSKILKRSVSTKLPPPEYKDVRQWWRGNQLKGL